MKIVYICTCSHEAINEEEVSTHLSANQEHEFKMVVRYEEAN